MLAIRNFLDIFGVLLQLPCVAVETEEQEDSNVLSEEGNCVSRGAYTLPILLYIRYVCTT